MLQRLRRKFIALNMAMVSVVVIAVLVLIGVYAWQQSVSTVYSALDRSLTQVTRTHNFPGMQGFGSMLFGMLEMPSSDWSEDKNSGHSGKDGSPRLGTEGASIPVAVYEISEGSSLSLMVQVTTASLDESLLSQVTQDIQKVESDRGFLASDGLFYSRQTVDSVTYVAFADSSSAIGLNKLLLPLFGLGLLTLALFFLISLYFSRWALRPVEEAWEKQRQFVADASHELKTPITVILANMSILQKHQLESVTSQAQWVESTQREAEGMQALVTDLLDLARAEDPAHPVFAEEINLSDVVEGSLLQFESVAFERDVLVEDHVAEGLVVSGARVQLERLLAILMDNACKYAQPGTVINVSLQKDHGEKWKNMPHSFIRGTMPKGTCAILSVSNQGEGIEGEDLPHVFDRFYRSDKARTRTEGSYGLGLAIAATTAEIHQGAILVQSVPGEVTTFMVALPLHEK